MISLQPGLITLIVGALTLSSCANQNQTSQPRQKSTSSKDDADFSASTIKDTSDGRQSADANAENDNAGGSNPASKIVDKEQLLKLAGDLESAGSDSKKAGEAAAKLEELLKIAKDSKLSLAARIARIQAEIKKLLADEGLKKNLAEQTDNFISSIDPEQIHKILESAKIKLGDPSDLATQVLNTAEKSAGDLIDQIVKEKSEIRTITISPADAEKLKAEISAVRKEIEETVKILDTAEGKQKLENLKAKLQDLIKKLLATK